MRTTLITNSPDETFKAGEDLSHRLQSGDLVLLFGGLGAGKTLFTKGMMHGLGFEVDEVTSPSFALVNLYRTDRFDVYHIDLWRLDASSHSADAVGLEEILENPGAVTIIEWADRLGKYETGNNTVRVTIEGDGDDPRTVDVVTSDRGPVKS